MPPGAGLVPIMRVRHEYGVTEGLRTGLRGQLLIKALLDQHSASRYVLGSPIQPLATEPPALPYQTPDNPSFHQSSIKVFML